MASSSRHSSTLPPWQGQAGFTLLSDSRLLQGLAALAPAPACLNLRFSRFGGWQRPLCDVAWPTEKKSMSQLDQSQVFQTLCLAPNARLEHCAELGQGLSVALWRNRHDTRTY